MAKRDTDDTAAYKRSQGGEGSTCTGMEAQSGENGAESAIRERRDEHSTRPVTESQCAARGSRSGTGAKRNETRQDTSQT